MALLFYYGSGSVFAWRVWLALEHKKVPYEQKTLSFSAGDHRKPEFLALNPRHKVPTVVDDGFAMYESAAVIEYLDERFPDGPSLFPGDVRTRGVTRRIVREIDGYLNEPFDKVAEEVFFKKPGEWDETQLAAARTQLLEEVDFFEKMLTKDWLAGDKLSAADITLYPFVCTFGRFEKKKPDLNLLGALGPKLTAWYKRFQALPYADKTYPPHWRG